MGGVDLPLRFGGVLNIQDYRIRTYYHIDGLDPTEWCELPDGLQRCPFTAFVPPRGIVSQSVYGGDPRSTRWSERVVDQVSGFAAAFEGLVQHERVGRRPGGAEMGRRSC